MVSTMKLRSGAVQLFSVFVGVLLAFSTASAKPLVPLAPEVMNARAAELAHLTWNGKSTTHDVERKSGCWFSTEKIEVWDPITKQGLIYSVKVQRPVVNYKVPVVLIVPTIEGTHPLLEPHIAQQLCDAKIASIIANVNDNRQPTPLPAWGYEDVNNRRAVLALSTFIDWAEKIPMFDRTKIGMMGLSLGGITTAMMAGVEPRLRATVIVVGGGNMPYILTASDEDRIATLRANRMKAGNVPNLGAYEEILRDTIKYDPFYFAPRANRFNMLMVMAETDTKVPFVVQKEQFAAFGGPNSMTFANGHVATIVSLSYLYMDKVIDFYNKKFAPGFLSGETEAVSHEVVDLDELGL
jgi:dienelactone hydrolase